MFTFVRKTAAVAALSLAVMSLTACGGNVEGVLKDANIAVEEVNGEDVVSFMTALDTQDLMISAATLPIAKNLGTLEILNDVTSGKTYLKLSFKLGKALKLPSFQYSSKMPNGMTVPLTGINLSRMMAFDLGSKGSKVYLYYDAATKKSVLGVALNVEALAIGVPATVLKTFKAGNATGVAGLYFGSEKNQSGLGIFTDLSGMFSGILEADMMAKKSVGFVEKVPSKENQSLIDRRIYKLSTQKIPIRVK